jgi:hypothetical protein
MTIIIEGVGANVPALSRPNYAAGSMSFLQLVQRLRSESGTSGGGPVTVSGATGEIKSLCNWVADAWMNIQMSRRDWFFMRQPVEFTTAPGKSSYTTEDAGIDSFADFKLDSFRQYSVAAGFASESRLAYQPYDLFRDSHLFGAQRSNTQMPVDFTVDPGENFILGPIPDTSYVINGECYARPTVMELDGDCPTMPSQYHMMIVWRALMYYGQNQAAPEAYTHGQNEYSRMMSELMRDQLPTFTVGGALC